MNGRSGIQQNLQLLIDPQSLGSTQIVSTNVNNAAPTIRTRSPTCQWNRSARTLDCFSWSLPPMTKVKPLDLHLGRHTSACGGEATFAINGNNEAKRTHGHL